MAEIDRSLRFRAFLNEWFAILLVALLILTVLTGWWAYSVNLDPTVETEQRLTEQWSESTSYSHSVEIQREATPFPAGEVIENRPLYYTATADSLDGIYRYEYQADSGNVEVATETFLLIQAGEFEDGRIEDPFWEVTEPLRSDSDRIEPGETHTVRFSVDIQSVLETIATVEAELDSTQGQVDVRVISVTSNSGILSMNQPLSSVETLGPNERVTVDGTISANRSRTEDVTLSIMVTGERERIETSRVVTVDVDLGERPAACPVSLDAVSVGEDALGTQQGDDIDLSDVEIDGNVLADDDVDLEDVTVTGDVIADGDIDLRNTTVGGTVTADGDIDIVGGAVHGDVEADGDIDIRGQQDVVSVRGTVQADGDIDLRGVAIGGDVESDGDIDIQTSNSSSTICGTLIADGNVSLSGSNQHPAETGPIDADGDVDVGNHATVFDTVDSDGDVTVRGTVEGGVFAGGTVSGNGTIHGNDPREDDDGGSGGSGGSGGGGN